MARGNDPDAAKDFEQKYGAQGNAEKLIQAQRARFPRELLAAQRKRLDVAASDALDLEALSKQVGKSVQAAAVKGDTVIYVYLEDGDHIKGCLPASEVASAKTDAKGDPSKSRGQAQKSPSAQAQDAKDEAKADDAKGEDKGSKD